MTDNPSKTPATVFLVVSDTDERSQLNSWLAHSGSNIRAYQSAGEFLLDRPDMTDSIVVADFRLPGMTGVDLFEYLHHVHPSVSVVFIADRTDALAVIRNTMAEFLIRPVHPEKLRETITRVFNGEELDKSELQSDLGQITDREYAFFFPNTSFTANQAATSPPDWLPAPGPSKPIEPGSWTKLAPMICRIWFESFGQRIRTDQLIWPTIQL